MHHPIKIGLFIFVSMKLCRLLIVCNFSFFLSRKIPWSYDMSLDCIWSPVSIWNDIFHCFTEIVHLHLLFRHDKLSSICIIGFYKVIALTSPIHEIYILHTYVWGIIDITANEQKKHQFGMRGTLTVWLEYVIWSIWSVLCYYYHHYYTIIIIIERRVYKYIYAHYIIVITHTHYAYTRYFPFSQNKHLNIVYLRMFSSVCEKRDRKKRNIFSPSARNPICIQKKLCVSLDSWMTIITSQNHSYRHHYFWWSIFVEKYQNKHISSQIHLILRKF